jgi:hypothetical protein
MIIKQKNLLLEKIYHWLIKYIVRNCGFFIEIKINFFYNILLYFYTRASVVKLVDALDSKSSGEIRAGSSPARGTIVLKKQNLYVVKAKLPT